MNVAEVTEVCRLCPTKAIDPNQKLINIFDYTVTEKYNLKDVIFMTTGVEISETDIVSRKICPKCLKHAQKIYQIRQIASKQDKHLKELSVKYLDDKGIRLPNTCITMKRNIQAANRADRKLTPLTESTCTKSKIIKKTEKFKPYPPLLPFTSTMKPIKGLHQSVIDVYRRFPKFKLPKKCLDRHLAPIISLTMGEVETFFKENKLDMNKFIYRSHQGNNAQPRIKCNSVARKKTATPVKSVADLRKQKKNMPSDEICKLLNVVANEAENSRKPIEIPEVPVVRPSAVRRGRPMKFFRNPACSPIKCESDKQVIETISNVVCNQLDDSAPVNETLVKIKEESISPKIRQKKRMLLLPNSTYQKMCKVFEHQYPTQPEIKAQPAEPSPPDSLSNTSKPDFIQSLGLAPAGEAVVPKSILVCKICGSVHKNVTSLKTHSSRHRICPHCKLKFKSVERKQNHIEKDCETKKILESPGSFISLTRAELDDDLRENYLEAFYNAEIVLRPEEQIVLDDDDDDDDEIILVSDETTKKIPSSEAEQSIDSVSIIKPIIKIHNNSLLDQLGNNTNEKEFLNDLVYLFRQKYPAFQSAQTDQPIIKSQDVVFEENGRCRLKNLKELLLTYNVPVSFQNGSLNVSFQPHTPLPNKKCELDTWNDLPLIDKQDPPNQSYPVTFVQSSQLSLSSIQVMTATPTMSIILPNAISIQTGVNNSPQTTQFFTPNTQQTATLQPMVQNYTIPINFPVIKNQMSVSSPSSAPTTSPKRECAAATAESSPTTSSSSSKSSSSDVELTASPKTKTKKLRVRMARSLRLRKVWELN
ncbi:uncharacterized protein LOC126743026 isoform X1 [Anthonomus grandis grandis]|uniref:uncharacterized protein LOC126743026 isoform X1 n=1 Tax=Anthonomus grandis grandis TaxID=2921223 RepID=UPI0021668715|nr:uncharacterized protein LOC126743026 isoform X1 [Anthonomus grandis grandis]